MMKRIVSMMLVLMLCVISMTALAETNTSAQLDHITDDAKVFSDDELAAYEKTARTLSDKYQCGIYFVTLEDYTQIAEGESDDVAEYIYQTYELGYGEDQDGMLMLVSVAEGDCALVSYGVATELVDCQQLLDDCVAAYGDKGYADILDAYLIRLPAIFSDGDAPTEQRKPTENRQAAFIERDGYVTDLYELLTENEEAALEEKAAELSEAYDCGVYIIIVRDYRQYGEGSPYDVAGDVFLACDLGEGPQKAGVLLMMSMSERDVTILTNEAGHAMVGPDAKDWLAVNYLKHFKKNAWAKGFDAFLTKLDTVLDMAAKGNPMTWLTFPETLLFGALIAILGGFGIGYGLLASVRNKMKSVFKAAFADKYIAQGGANITGRVDRFSHKKTTRRKIETSSSLGGSGGSRSSDSRGFSGRSDKF